MPSLTLSLPADLVADLETASRLSGIPKSRIVSQATAIAVAHLIARGDAFDQASTPPPTPPAAKAAPPAPPAPIPARVEATPPPQPAAAPAEYTNPFNLVPRRRHRSVLWELDKVAQAYGVEVIQITAHLMTDDIFTLPDTAEVQWIGNLGLDAAALHCSQASQGIKVTRWIQARTTEFRKTEPELS